MNLTFNIEAKIWEMNKTYILDFHLRDPDNFWHRIARTNILNFLETKKLVLGQMKIISEEDHIMGIKILGVSKKSKKQIQKNIARLAKLGSWNFQYMKVLCMGKFTPKNWKPNSGWELIEMLDSGHFMMMFIY